MRIQTCFGFWGWARCSVSCWGLFFSTDVLFDNFAAVPDLSGRGI